MAVDVIGPLSVPKNAAFAANRLVAGVTVVAWDGDGDLLRTFVERLPSSPPGRLCTWTGVPGEALEAFIREVLDPPVK